MAGGWLVKIIAALVLATVGMVGYVAAGAWMAAYGRPSADARAIEARLLALPSSPVPIATLRPQEDWDIVCRLDPYSFPSRVLPRYLGKPLRGYRYDPRDEWIDENWNGLAFIDDGSRVVHVLTLPNKTIGHLEGERCISRTDGKVGLARIEAQNSTFLQIEFSK